MAMARVVSGRVRVPLRTVLTVNHRGAAAGLRGPVLVLITAASAITITAAIATITLVNAVATALRPGLLPPRTLPFPLPRLLQLRRPLGLLRRLVRRRPAGLERGARVPRVLGVPRSGIDERMP